MKNYAYLVTLIIFTTSCYGQGKPDSANEKIIPSNTPVIQLVTPPLDKDSYFVKPIDTVSANGPRVITRNILEDKNGDLWLASWNGLLRYDGKLFTNFSYQAGLRKYRMFSLLEDKTGNLWLGTVGAGVYRFDGKNFTNFTTIEGLADNKIECMLEDEKGRIWLGTGGGVSCYDGKSFQNFTIKEGLIDLDVHTIAQDKTGKIWVGTTGGICFYHGKTFTHFANKEGLAFKNVRTIQADKNGNLLFGGQEGLFKYDGRTIIHVLTNFVGYLYEDKKGILWMSAGEAEQTSNMVLYRYHEKPLPLGVDEADFVQVFKKEGQIFGITEDKNGNIWFGTTEGVGRYDGKTFEFFRNEKAKE